VLREDFELLLGEILGVDQVIARSLERRHDLVQLELHRAGFLVLRALDQEHHQERHDRRARIDHELPRIGIVEQRAGQQPREHDTNRDCEGPIPSDPKCGLARDVLEEMIDRVDRAASRGRRRRFVLVLFAHIDPIVRSSVQGRPVGGRASSCEQSIRVRSRRFKSG
jgi:hypothetical protein